MAETVILATPVTPPSLTAWSLKTLTLDLSSQLVAVHLISDTGQLLYVNYPTPAPAGSTQPTGAALLISLNTANLTANSLVHRVFTRLITDGYLVGTVAGSPDA